MSIPDCVIAGAGPTGLTLALELLRRGKTVRIFDRSSGPRPEDQSRALGILPSTLSVLEPSGITTCLLEEGLKIEQARVFFEDEEIFSLGLKNGGGRWPFVLSLPQGRTERILLSEVERAGVEVEWEAEVTGVAIDGDEPALEVVRSGTAEKIAGRFVAGCDGIRSRIREALGIAFTGDELDTPFSLADVQLREPLPQASARIDLFESGIIIQLPLPNGAVRLIAPSPDVGKRAEIASKIKETVWESDFTISFRHAEKLQSGKVFLAGDAAHVHSPAGGRGMNTGIGDAAWLAWLISEGRESEYEAMRLPVAKHILKVTRQMTRGVTAPPERIRFYARNLVRPLLALPFVDRLIAKRILAHDMPHAPWIDNAAW